MDINPPWLKKNVHFLFCHLFSILIWNKLINIEKHKKHTIELDQRYVRFSGLSFFHWPFGVL